jgi:hypothetical protein
MDPLTDDGRAPRSELDRLRALLGPSERSYETLRADVDHAETLARDAQHELGRQRGEMAELRVQLARARQDQDTFQRRREMSAGAYLVDLVREGWIEVLRPRAGRVARAVGLRRPG